MNAKLCNFIRYGYLTYQYIFTTKENIFHEFHSAFIHSKLYIDHTVSIKYTSELDVETQRVENHHIHSMTIVNIQANIPIFATIFIASTKGCAQYTV